MSELVSKVDSYSLPSVVADWPGMITLDERKVLHHLASSHYSGEGIILDAGIFLGASTVAFCEGLAEQEADLHVTRSRLRPGQSFEKAQWVSSGFDKYVSEVDPGFGLPPEGFRDGDDYSKFLQQVLSKYRDRFDLHFGNIESANLEGNPTGEIAFFDRDWEVFKKFGPGYMPGATLIVHQDRFFEYALE